jgi:hypothetical protein
MATRFLPLGWAIFLLETGKGRPYPYDMPVNMWAPPKPVEATS